MRITDVASIILQHEMDEPLGFSQGYYHQRTAHLVRVHTDEGLSGVGEIFGAGNVAFANQAIVRHVLSPLLIGRNPLDTNAIWHDLYNHLRDHGQKGMPIASFPAWTSRCGISSARPLGYPSISYSAGNAGKITWRTVTA